MMLKRLLTLVSLAASLLTALAASTACTEFPSTDAGYVFVDGEYLDPPYRVEVVKGNIVINGHVVREMPHLPQERVPQAAPPETPENARELLDVAEAWMEQNDFEMDALVAHLEGFAATAEVNVSEGSVTIIDTDGNVSFFLLDGVAPPDEDLLQAEQEALTAHWHRLLASGGVLVTMPGGAVEVPPEDAETFLESIVAALEPDTDEAERLEALWGLLGSREAALALLERGMDEDLQDRLASTVSQATGTGGGGATPDPGRPTGATEEAVDPYAISRTPGTNVAHLFTTLGSLADYASVGLAAERHGYRVVRYERSNFGAGTATIANLYRTSATAGILYARTDGGREAMCVEQYAFKADRDDALTRYLEQGYGGAVYATWVASTATGTIKSYVLCATGRGIAERWQDAHTIVELDVCDGFALAQAFSARELIAPDESCPPADASGYNTGLWARLDGTLGDGAERTVEAAFQAAFGVSDGPVSLESLAGEDQGADSVRGFRHVSRSSGQTVLSPSVVSVSPTGTVGVGQAMTGGRIVFDAAVSLLMAPRQVLSASGSCQPRVTDVQVADAHTLTFSFLPARPGTASFRINRMSIASADNGVLVDGNRDPWKTDRSGLNSDAYVWEVRCEGPVGGASAAP